MNKEGEIVPYIRVEVPQAEEVETDPAPEPAPVAETPDASVTPEPELDASEAELDAAIGEVSEEPAVAELNRNGWA